LATRFNRTAEKTVRAQKLRRDATPWEQKLWQHLRGDQLQGASFRRQHPVGPYILDFYCSAAKLAIELDGDQHAVQREYDDARTKFLNEKGIRVMRFWNIDLKENLEGVLDTIGRRVLELTPTRSASRSDLPLSGGGEEPESDS
jgi:very-short-patch-repair endonuclease